MPEKHRPQRRCSGCGQMKDKASLIRIVRTPEGDFHIDQTNKASGRGAYLCRNEQCLALARRNHGLERSFRQKLGDDIYEKLSEELKGK